MGAVETPPDIFDRPLVALRRERAAGRIAQVAPILDAAAWDRLGLAPERLLDLAEEGFDQVDEIVSAFFPVRKN